MAAAAAMTATIQNDYPTESSRGRVIGFSSAFNALGIVFATRLVSALPKWLQDAGLEPVAAGRYAYGTAALLCFVSLLIFRFGLKAGVPEEVRQRPRWWALIRSGIEEMRNPRIMLAYLYTVTARGALVVAGPVPFPVGHHRGQGRRGRRRRCAVPGMAAIHGGPGVRRGLVVRVRLDTGPRQPGRGSGPVDGDGDRRLRLDVFRGFSLDLRMLPLFALLGASMASGMMSSMALVGQEAPPAKRGAVIGLLSVFGSVGIILVANIGGALFSGATPWAPFLLIAGSNSVLIVVAIVIWVVAPGEWKPGAAAAMGRH